MEGSTNSDEGFDRENVLVIPYQKQELLKSELQSLNIDLPPSNDGDNSSVASMNESCESPLSSSWDSEPETYIPSLINCHEGINLEENYLDMEEHNQFVGVENTDDGLLWEMDNRSYDDLLKKFMEKEEELRFSNFRLQLSEQEIIKLNDQVENSEAQLHNVREELKLKKEELNLQKELSEEEISKLKLSEEEILKLKIQIDKSENRLNNVREELKLKEEELSKLKELSEEEIFNLKIQNEKSENRLDNVREELKIKEEELKLKEEELELSEEEIFKLKIQTEKSENRLDSVSEELKLKEEELNKQKELAEEEIFKLKIQVENRLDNVQEELNLKVEKLQKQNAELNTDIIPEFSSRITNLAKQLEVAHEKLKILNFENANLKKELEKKSTETDELQGQLKVAQENMAKSELELVSNRKQIQMYESKATNYEQEVQKLNSELLDLQAKFSLEKDELHFDIASSLDFWTKRNTELTSKLEDCQSRNKELENNLSRDRAAKVAQEMVLEKEINGLREELGQKMHLVQAANNEKEVVVIQRNEAKAKIKKLEHEIFSWNDQLLNTRGYVKELEASLSEICAIYKTIRNEGKMLKLRVEELEKEVTRQNGVISDKDEEKREAIRQLCYSIEYYRSEYRQLVQAINKVASPRSPWSHCYSFLRLH